MQDLSTGEMRDLTPFLNDIPVIGPAEILSAMDKAQPDRSKQGPVFMVGEIIELRGGRFQITRIEPGHMRLKSLPSI